MEQPQKQFDRRCDHLILLCDPPCCHVLVLQMSTPRNNELPHKPEPQTSEDRKWGSGEWNPNICNLCEKRVGHPIHSKRYRNNPTLYKLEHPNK